MDFRQIATKEASALVASVADRLAALATSEIDKQTDRVRKDADAALTAAHAEADAALAAARRDAEAAVAAVKKDLAAEAARRDEIAAALKRAGDQIASLQATLEESDRARNRGVADLAATADELADARRSLEAAQQEAAARLAETSARIQMLEQEVAESEALRTEQSRIAREQLANAARVPLDRLRAAFARFSSATTVQETLAVMMDALATEFSRVALFEVSGNKLEGTRHAGFDDAKDVSKLVVPLSVDSVLTEAVRSRRVHGLTGAELAQGSRTLFGGSPTFALAVPIEVRGAVIAVVYADDSSQASAEGATSDRRVKFTEILLWHAVPLMARLAAEAEEE